MPLVGVKANAGAFGLGWSAVLPGEELGGMVLLTPTSIAYTGTSASIGTNGSVEFTACSSLSMNGVFSADYDNYMVFVRSTFTSDRVAFRSQLRSSGVNEDSASDYYTRERLLSDGTTVSAARGTDNYAEYGYLDNEAPNGHMMTYYGPYLAQPTAMRSVTVFGHNNAAIRDYASTHSLSSSYDGFTLFTVTGLFTGLVSVFGLVGA